MCFHEELEASWLKGYGREFFSELANHLAESPAQISFLRVRTRESRNILIRLKINVAARSIDSRSYEMRSLGASGSPKV